MECHEGAQYAESSRDRPVERYVSWQPRETGDEHDASPSRPPARAGDHLGIRHRVALVALIGLTVGLVVVLGAGLVSGAARVACLFAACVFIALIVVLVPPRLRTRVAPFMVAFVAAVGVLPTFLSDDDGGKDEPSTGRGTADVIGTSTGGGGAPTTVIDPQQALLALIPTSIRDSCGTDDLSSGIAGVMCEALGATFYYELYRDPLEARSSFEISVGNAIDARGHAETCRDASPKRPFVGTWGQPGQSNAGGQLLCEWGGKIATWEWTVAGRPILARLLYSGDQQTAAAGADRAWRVATT
jgi:hypothetical protein